MKIETNYEKEKGMITIPTIAIGYHTKQHRFAIVLMFFLLGIFNRIYL